MRLICIGDIGIHGSIPLHSPWPRPTGSQHDEDETCILFNWEFPCGITSTSKPRSGPGARRFVAPPESVGLLQGWAPATAALANNHLMDAGATGVSTTIAALHEVGIPSFGVGVASNLAPQSWIWETKEGRLGIINWVTAETHPDPSDGHRLGPNPWPGYDDATIQIDNLRARTDWIIVYVHWSDELFPYPRPEDRQMAKRLIELGADAVVGHHPHVVRGIETVNAKPIFYSLGNYFFSNVQSPTGEWILRQVTRNREALVVEFNLRRGKELTWDLHSYWQKETATSLDPNHRAVRRAKKVSHPFHLPEYAVWYNKTRQRFDKFGYRFHFRLPQLGWQGALNWLLRSIMNSTKSQ